MIAWCADDADDDYYHCLSSYYCIILFGGPRTMSLCPWMRYHLPATYLWLHWSGGAWRFWMLRGGDYSVETSSTCKVRIDPQYEIPSPSGTWHVCVCPVTEQLSQRRSFSSLVQPSYSASDHVYRCHRLQESRKLSLSSSFPRGGWSWMPIAVAFTSSSVTYRLLLHGATWLGTDSVRLCD